MQLFGLGTLVVCCLITLIASLVCWPVIYEPVARHNEKTLLYCVCFWGLIVLGRANRTRHTVGTNMKWKVISWASLWPFWITHTINNPSLSFTESRWMTQRENERFGIDMTRFKVMYFKVCVPRDFCPCVILACSHTISTFNYPELGMFSTELQYPNCSVLPSGSACRGLELVGRCVELNRPSRKASSCFSPVSCWFLPCFKTFLNLYGSPQLFDDAVWLVILGYAPSVRHCLCLLSHWDHVYSHQYAFMVLYVTHSELKWTGYAATLSLPTDSPFPPKDKVDWTCL